MEQSEASEQTPTQSYIESVKTRLGNQEKTRASREEQLGSDQTSDIVFETLQKYASGEVDGDQALDSLRTLADHSLRNHYLNGMQTMWPNILSSATQIAITERAKK